MKMKKILILCLFITPILRGQSPLFTIYREQTAMINPAMPSTNYLISEYNNSISATYRYQWIGVEGAPTTQVLNWECLPIDKNILVGAQLMNDKTGEIGLTGISGQFAYKMALSRMDNRFLSIGLSAGIQYFHANLSTIAASENLFIDNKRQIIPDLNIGVYYHHDKEFYVGLSTPQLVGNRIYLNNSENSPLSIQKPRQICAVGGMYFDAPYFGNDGAYLEPSVWLRYLPEYKNFSFDAHLRAKISSSFWVGAGYNLYANTMNIETGSILSESIGLNAGQLKIGLGGSIPFGSKWTGLGASGEVHVCYSWGQ